MIALIIKNKKIKKKTLQIRKQDLRRVQLTNLKLLDFGT